ncbi:GDSL esterase/lipase At1g29660-like [Euphorbia lathyris]|uniref:GDSL esterase/lipase At1g29660-like n=1 Tax=Euphorbia lathyris TaxID=212925 RepID=UPI0033131AA3
MGSEVIKLWIITILMVLGVASSSSSEDYSAEAEGWFRKVPCYFIFGDSLADSGNNNNLQTLAKVDYQPYGIDFPQGPTGRFTNGRTIVDVIAELLGFKKYIRPYASYNFFDILSGVNYASGSAGILNETAQQVGERITFDMQLENHRKVMLCLTKFFITEKLAKWYLNKCFYSVGFGNNDYINNYFVPDYYDSSHKYTLHQFTQLLIEQYTNQIKRLYSYGARKIAIFGLGSLGCTPFAIATYGNGSSCSEIMEEASRLFNSLLIPLVDQLNRDFSDATFTYINCYGIGQIAAEIGFTNTTSACCPVVNGGPCIPDEIPCKNRTTYAFWDSFHPTEALNKYIGQRSFQALYPSDAHPFDIRTLLLPNQQISAV